jgi:aryl-alcohol dehydrogenase
MESDRQIIAAVCAAHGEPFQLENVQLAPCRANEIIVRIVAVGMCHTDIAVRDGISPIPAFPAILGHEGAGIVEKVGESVTNLRPNDHVVLSFTSCGGCPACSANRPSRCENFALANFRGCRADNTHTHSRNGQAISGNFFGQSSFSTYALVDARNAVKVPDDVPLEILGPLGCGVQTGAGTVLNRLKPEPGSSMVIFGAGAVGLAAVMAAKLAGCNPIIAVDMRADRLDLATELGATHSLVARRPDLLSEITAITHGGARHVIEASGAAAAVSTAIQSVRAGGAVCLVGFTAPGTQITLPAAAFTKGTIQFVVEGDSVPAVFLPQLIEYYRQGRFPFDRLVKFYDFKDINKAADDAESGRVIKPVLRVSSVAADGSAH